MVIAARWTLACEPPGVRTRVDGLRQAFGEVVNLLNQHTNRTLRGRRSPGEPNQAGDLLATKDISKLCAGPPRRLGPFATAAGPTPRQWEHSGPSRGGVGARNRHRLSHQYRRPPPSPRSSPMQPVLWLARVSTGGGNKMENMESVSARIITSSAIRNEAAGT